MKTTINVFQHISLSMGLLTAMLFYPLGASSIGVIGLFAALAYSVYVVKLHNDRNAKEFQLPVFLAVIFGIFMAPVVFWSISLSFESIESGVVESFLALMPIFASLLLLNRCAEHMAMKQYPELKMNH